MKKLSLLVPFLLASVCAFGEPVTLTNRQASELLQNLLHIDAGLTAANSTLVAKDINILRPSVEAYTKGNEEARKKYGVTQNTPSDAKNALPFIEEITTNGDAHSIYDLNRVTLSDDELIAAKITPACQSCLLLYLGPVSAKK